MHFTVALCVYIKDNPKYFKEALESIVNQTKLPSQVVIVVDGEINKLLSDVIEAMKKVFIKLHIDCDIEYLPNNVGHGKARRLSIEKAKYQLIALMDADDISRSYRFQKQLEAFKNNPMLSIVGGQIAEIQHNTKKEIGKRVVPQTDAEIKHYIKSRCPFNQMTVMFKKDAVLEAGNYQDFFHNEDYYLWIRMYLKGFSFYNLEDVLVDVRVNEEFYARRGGWRYFMSEYKILHIMYKNGIISLPKYLFNVTIRFVLQVVLSDGMRGYIFKKLARKRN
jgi:glycosyltransferase involved in cell wall biosynthesis